MCGIFGAVGGSLAEADCLEALRTLTHRGPDSEGHEHFPESDVFLGHRRLAIVDLSPDGAQPMANEDRTVFLTLNGEIYNHEELRAGLIERGHRFVGRCDAEVVLHLYEEKGIACVDDLVGMFAFGIWDATQRKLFLARDRIGIKPLYYYDDGARVAFASELKALRALPGLDLQPDATAYYDFLTYEFVPAPKTVFTKVRKLPAGHWLEWSAAGSRVEEYWRPTVEPRGGRELDDLLEELDAALGDVVAAHLMSDVPLGVFLSAGVDSSLVSALAMKSVDEPLQAFTVDFEDYDKSEGSEAVKIAEQLGMRHRMETFGEPELLAGLERMPELFDEPFADASALPMIGLCRQTAQHVKVVLSGDGGDETHAGYSRYIKRARKQAAYARADLVPGLAGLAGLPPLRSIRWARPMREDPLGRPYSFHMGLPREAKRRILGGLGREFDDYDDYWAIRPHANELDSLRGQQLMDLRSHLPEGILTKVDRTSMRFGLEVRPPLLDHRLVELGLSLPDEAKVDGERQKLLLRRLLSRYLPPEITEARKRAFSVPMKRFVRDGLVGLPSDLDVFGAFRVDAAKARSVFRNSGDYQVHWILHALSRFVEP